MSQISRGLGWVLLLFGIYGLIPNVSYPTLVEGATRLGVSIGAILSGALTIMSAESWLVWFQTERNTQAIIDELERLNTTVERLYKESLGKKSA